MNDTPRTDNMRLKASYEASRRPELMFPDSYQLGMLIEFARTLERELNYAKQELLCERLPNLTTVNKR